MTPKPKQLPLFAGPLDVPLRPTGPSLASILVDLASADGGYIRSTPTRIRLIEEGLLDRGASGRTRLYRALTRFGRFRRLRHGVYELNPEYERKQPPYQGAEPPLTPEQEFLRRRLQSYGSLVNRN